MKPIPSAPSLSTSGYVEGKLAAFSPALNEALLRGWRRLHLVEPLLVHDGIHVRCLNVIPLPAAPALSSLLSVPK
ncbi:MAG: hypothetical protein IT518_00925 [Burkholderiales bacterium]|nr:hypothetical protein [Burkholderiales bacterium]